MVAVLFYQHMVSAALQHYLKGAIDSCAIRTKHQSCITSAVLQQALGCREQVANRNAAGSSVPSSVEQRWLEL